MKLSHFTLALGACSLVAAIGPAVPDDQQHKHVLARIDERMLELGAKFEQDMLGVLEADEIQEFKESLMEFAGNTTAVIANNVNSTVGNQLDWMSLNFIFGLDPELREKILSARENIDLSKRQEYGDDDGHGPAGGWYNDCTCGWHEALLSCCGLCDACYKESHDKRDVPAEVKKMEQAKQKGEELAAEQKAEQNEEWIAAAATTATPVALIQNRDVTAEVKKMEQAKQREDELAAAVITPAASIQKRGCKCTAYEFFESYCGQSDDADCAGPEEKDGRKPAKGPKGCKCTPYEFMQTICGTYFDCAGDSNEDYWDFLDNRHH